MRPPEKKLFPGREIASNRIASIKPSSADMLFFLGRQKWTSTLQFTPSKFVRLRRKSAFGLDLDLDIWPLTLKTFSAVAIHSHDDHRHVCQVSFKWLTSLHQSRRRPPPDLPTGEGATGKRALSRCKGGPERALLVGKGRIGWRKGRIRLERAT